MLRSVLVGLVLLGTCGALRSRDGAGVKFRDCGSKKGTITSVNVVPCPGGPASCDLRKGTSPKISVTFKPSEDVTKVTAVVHGIIHGFPAPFTPDNPDGCKDSGLACPLKAGAEVTYSTSIKILPVYPKLLLLVRWELRDQNNEDIACAVIRARIN